MFWCGLKLATSGLVLGLLERDSGAGQSQPLPMCSLGHLEELQNDLQLVVVYTWLEGALEKLYCESRPAAFNAGLGVT